jgi:hypothetical protein
MFTCTYDRIFSCMPFTVHKKQLKEIIKIWFLVLFVRNLFFCDNLIMLYNKKKVVVDKIHQSFQVFKCLNTMNSPP